LWRGAYLEGVELESSVRDSLYLALYSQAEQLLQSDPKETDRLGQMLLQAEPYEAKYLSLCLRALRANNNHKTMGRIYRKARERFAEVGEQLPEGWSDFLGALA
jgi:hypothetical protein